MIFLLEPLGNSPNPPFTHASASRRTSASASCARWRREEEEEEEEEAEGRRQKAEREDQEFAEGGGGGDRRRQQSGAAGEVATGAVEASWQHEEAQGSQVDFREHCCEVEVAVRRDC